MKVKKGKMIYEGKAKKIYKTEDPDLLVQHFKDDATAFNAKKRGTIVNKGVMNNRISERLFKLLERKGSRRTSSRGRLPATWWSGSSR